MSWSARGAWILWTAFVVTVICAAYVGLNPASGPPIGVIDIVWASSFVGFPTVGALVVTRFPRRPLGWLLCLAPLVLMLGVLLSDVARRGIADPSPSWEWLAWFSSLLFPIGLGLIAVTPLLLPNGELPSPRWRAVVWLIAVGGAGGALVEAVRPGIYEIGAGFSDPGRGDLRNPLGIEALRGSIDLLGAVTVGAVMAGLVLAVISVPIRFRRAHGTERQQLKWLALGAVSISLCLLMALLLGAIGFSNGYVETGLAIGMILALPVSIGLAVRRERLYDVDVLINRTIVYALLSAILGVAYLGVVIILQAVLGSWTVESDLTVAGSTLAVAALFRPVRASVQSFIDQRFYRRRYDAGRTLASFSSRIRDSVDLDSLNGELIQVVGQTMQPAHASLWLRPTWSTEEGA